MQTGSAAGAVDFESLERFWLIRTTHQDGVADSSPRPGLTTIVDGTEFGVSDTYGTVSPAGVRQLQLIWVGAGEPGGNDWVLDGYGCWTTLVDRGRVGDVRYVEWKAIWRDITVFVAGVRNGVAHIFVTSGGVPEFEAPEVKHTGSLVNCWSAEVPVEELSLRSWRSVERPAGAGVVSGAIGFVRGRTTVLIRPKTQDGTEPGIVSVKKRGQNVTSDYIMHARLKDEVAPPVEWQAPVSASDITDLRQISATTIWQGEETAVDGVSDTDDTVFFAQVTAERPDTSEVVCTTRPIAPGALPAKALSLAGLYVYSELRP
ncbi:hypothetical protein [Cryobacterium sp. AP23]